jgi:hypothetical protein
VFRVLRYPDKEIHVIVDNLSTHTGDKIDKWLTKHPLHAQGSSWINQVGDMVRGHHTPIDPPGQFPIGSATRPAHRELHHPLEMKTQHRSRGPQQ